jgi:hypothetical protein
MKSNLQVLPTFAKVEVNGWEFTAEFIGEFDPLLDSGDDPSDYAPGWTWTASKPGEFAMSEEGRRNPAPEWAIQVGRALVKALQEAPVSKNFYEPDSLEVEVEI